MTDQQQSCEPIPHFSMQIMSDNLPFPPPPPLTTDHLVEANTPPVLERGSSVPQLSLQRAGRLDRSAKGAIMTKSRSAKHLMRPTLVTPKSPRKVKKLTVSFSNFANVQTLEKSADEVNASWLNRDDYSEISQGRKRCVENIKAAMLGQAPTPQDDLIDGLEESLSLRRVVERKKKNWAYRKLLIQEQKVQKEFGVSDPYALASLSAAFSSHSAQRAARRASMNNSAMEL